MGKFVITKRTDGDFQFNLKAGNGEIILSSEGYSSRSACIYGIDSVRTHSQDITKYNRKSSANGKAYFNLKASKRQIIGTSELYETETARDNGIVSVKTNAPGSGGIDLSAK